MILGKYPSQKLLKKYEMNSFMNLIDSFKSGNLKSFSHFSKHRLFIGNGKISKNVHSTRNLPHS
jgi:hypothetical protein